MDIKAKQDLITKNYNHIYAHEMAHKNAGGSFAGAITIERNSDGIPVSGHVPIKMPVMDKRNPQRTIELFEHETKEIDKEIENETKTKNQNKKPARRTAENPKKTNRFGLSPILQ